MTKATDFSDEELDKVKVDVESHQYSLGEILEKHQIGSLSTLQRWIKQFGWDYKHRKAKGLTIHKSK